MSLTIMRRRVGQLEQAGAAELPLYIRRWLGHPLTGDQHAQADHELVAAKAEPPIKPEEVSPEMREWLFSDHGNATTDVRTCA